MNKTVCFSIPKEVAHGRGYIYSLQYHIVWVTKYRKPIFTGEIKSDVEEYLIETLKSLDMALIAMEVMPDHVHLLVDCKPQLRLSDAIKVLKGNHRIYGYLSGFSFAILWYDDNHGDNDTCVCRSKKKHT